MQSSRGSSVLFKENSLNINFSKANNENIYILCVARRRLHVYLKWTYCRSWLTKDTRWIKNDVFCLLNKRRFAFYNCIIPISLFARLSVMLFLFDPNHWKVLLQSSSKFSTKDLLAHPIAQVFLSLNPMGLWVRISAEA